MKHIQTTDTKTGSVQFWQALPVNQDWPHTSHILRTYGENADLQKVREILKHLDESDARGIRLIALSVESDSEPITSRLQYRGYENDTAPLTIRGKALGEIEATMGHDGKSIYFRDTTYGHSLTAAQKEQLNSRFGAELLAAFTPELLADVKRDEKARVVAYIKAEVPNYRRQLDEIEAFNG